MVNFLLNLRIYHCEVKKNVAANNNKIKQIISQLFNVKASVRRGK